MIAAVALSLAGCATQQWDDPFVALSDTAVGPRIHHEAMAALDADPTQTEAYNDKLMGLVWRPGYTVQVREAAVERLKERDLDGLKRTLRQRLPRLGAVNGHARLCEIIAEEGWTDLSPALISSAARPMLFAGPDWDRPELVALSELYGRERVTDVIFEELLTTRRASDQAYRTRCWQLLTRLGERERLVDLLRNQDVPADDLFLVDLAAGARDLGIVPIGREDILWMRALRKPEHTEFWSEAVTAAAQWSPDRRATVELRDLPVAVAAQRHDPEMLTASTAALEADLVEQTRGQKHYRHGSNFDNRSDRDLLRDYRGELSWGDVAAMHLLLRAMAVPEVVDHLFDYAARDRTDESTEYGGVIALDRQGRFAVLEFPPRIRRHDQQFIAPQAMLDSAYTALFHFHFHVQRERNVDYAGPGFGDTQYADNTRANCVVLTSVGEGRMNVDFYRHGDVTVDLGVVAQSSGR